MDNIKCYKNGSNYASENDSLLISNCSKKLISNFNKTFIKDSKLRNLPGLIFFSFLLMSGVIAYDSYFKVKESQGKLSLPDFNSISTYIHEQTPIVKVLILINQLLLFAFTTSIMGTITSRQQYQQAIGNVLSKKTSLDLNFRKNGMFISCLISTFSSICLATGLLQQKVFIPNTQLEAIEAESYFLLDEYLIHAYLVSMLFYCIFYSSVMSSNYLEAKTASSSIFTGLVISLSLQIALFYFSYAAYSILDKISVSTKSHKITDYKLLLMISTDALFAFMILTSQVIIYLSRSYFSTVCQEFKEELEDNYELIQSDEKIKIERTCL